MAYLGRMTFAAAAACVSLGVAHAAPVITASIVPDPTAASLPSGLVLEDLGSGGGPGLVSSSPIVLSTGATVTFSPASGVYAGDVSGVTRSPFRDGSGNATDAHYLNAQAGTGGMTFSYTSMQTTFALLWGSVDPSPVSYNTLSFTFSGGGATETVTGADVFALVSGAVAGTTNLAVGISGLAAFDTITITASQQAFEFVPGRVAVPEPASLALLGAGLLGLGLVRRRRAG